MKYAGRISYLDAFTYERRLAQEDMLTKPVTVQEFQNMFVYIYTEANRRYSDSDLVFMLLEEIAGVMEIVRKDNLNDLPAQLARTYAGWSAVIKRLGIDAQETLWDKCPGVCPYCLREENCACGIEHPNASQEKKDLLLRRHRRERAAEPKSLAAYQAFHQKLYGSKNRQLFVIQIAAHLAEEGGEVSKEFRRKNRKGLQDEMADIAYWMLALANRCGFDLAEAVWQRYPYECDTCCHEICGCESG